MLTISERFNCARLLVYSFALFWHRTFDLEFLLVASTWTDIIKATFPFYINS